MMNINLKIPKAWRKNVAVWMTVSLMAVSGNNPKTENNQVKDSVVKQRVKVELKDVFSLEYDKTDSTYIKKGSS